MSRPRKPTALLEAAGAFRKNPARGRARQNEPRQTEGLGPCPAYLSKPERACWDRIVEICPEGVLKAADEAAVELAARLWARVRLGEFTAADSAQFKAALQQLGMTPAARSMVTATPPERGNAFGEL